MINCLTVVICLTWSTCCNIQPWKVYDLLAHVAINVVRNVSEGIVLVIVHDASVTRTCICKASKMMQKNVKIP